MEYGTRPREAGNGSEAGADPVLRAKYVDFCSAHLTEVFLSLSDERIYQLVEEAADEADLQVGSLGFTAMVRLATQRLRDHIPLPDYPSWRRDYLSDPSRYDPHLLGLWEELLPAPAGEEEGTEG